MPQPSENDNKYVPRRDLSARPGDPGTGPADQRFAGKDRDEPPQPQQAQPITSAPGQWNAGERNASEEGLPIRARSQQGQQRQSADPSVPEGVYGQSGSFGQVWRDTEGGIDNRDLDQEQAVYGNPDAGKQSGKQPSRQAKPRTGSDTPNPT